MITKKTDDGQPFLEVSTKAYIPEAILQTSYKFTNKCYLRVIPFTEEVYRIYFKTKGQNNFTLKGIVDEFCNELIDQQLRVMLEKRFGYIRDEIVKKAFSPID